jgi:hypothetical protein
VPDDLLAPSPIEPVGNREGNLLAGERKRRKPRPRLAEKGPGEQDERPEVLEVIPAAEPHELDELA